MGASKRKGDAGPSELLSAVRSAVLSGGELHALSAGEDMAEVIETAVRAFGRCRGVVSTAMVHVSACNTLLRLEREGLVSRWTFFVFWGIGRLHVGGAVDAVLRAVGDRIRGAVSHAKFCALEASDGRTLGILTSANLNRNCRSESYLISSDPALGRMLLDCCASLERFGAEYGRNAGYYDDAAESAFGACAVARSGESLSDMVRRLGA
jgi:hypothetical protein